MFAILRLTSDDHNAVYQHDAQHADARYDANRLKRVGHTTYDAHDSEYQANFESIQNVLTTCSLSETRKEQENYPYRLDKRIR